MNKVSKNQMEKLPYIIAVDFDGTLVEDRFPNIGRPIWKTIGEIQNRQSNGAKIILWTCRDHENLKEAIEYCENNLHIVFDAVNTNIEETKNMFDNDTRKVYANEYWDDKCAIRYANKNLEFNRYERI